MGHAFLIYFVSNSPVAFTSMVIILIASLFAMLMPSVFIKLVLHPYGIMRRREYYRLISADLVHNDGLHLFLNEFMLVTFGISLEKYLRNSSPYGSLQFLLIYMSGCLTGAIATTWLKREEVYYTSAGASGSIMGCMFSYIILQPDVIAYYLPVIGPIKNIYGGLLLIIAMMVCERRKKNPVSSYEVHFYGAVGGVVTTLAIFPRLL